MSIFSTLTFGGLHLIIFTPGYLIAGRLLQLHWALLESLPINFRNIFHLIKYRPAHKWKNPGTTIIVHSHN